MSTPSSPHGPIMVVIVLYQRGPSESQSYSSLSNILSSSPDLAKSFSVILYDNSPAAHECPSAGSFPLAYRHDPTNAGLATAFNFALEQAEASEYEWLLVLDQDTSPTKDFLFELVQCVDNLHAERHVAAIVPKLLVRGRLQSPEAHFIDQLRHQYRRSGHALKRDSFGVQPGRPSAYNSGATFRVSALRSIGGFPTSFWLDYLDHAVFHALSSHGFQMYVLHAEIEHEISQANLDKVPAWRQRNFLAAQTLFVKQTGGILDRILFRIWVLRYSRTLWINHPDRRLWKEALLHAFVLGIPRTSGGER